MNLSQSELRYMESMGGCDDESDDETCSTGMNQRGDLLLCDKHAADYPANIGRVEGEVRCWCGGFRPPGTDCGEPCDGSW